MSEIVKKWLEEVQRDWPDLWIPGLANRGMESFLEHTLQVGDLHRLVEAHRLVTDYKVQDPAADLCRLARLVTGAPEGSNDPIETLFDLADLVVERQKQEAAASDSEENSQE